MTRPAAARRPGYTLIEILVASVIGLVLMGALYTAFSLIINDTTVGRDLTAESNLSRGIINRVGIDLGSPVGVLPPKSGGDPGAGGSGDSLSTEEESLDEPTTPTTGTLSTDGMTTTSTSAALNGTDIPFQAGIVGSSGQLIIFLSRSPEYVRRRDIPYDPTLIQPADLVKVTYYLHSNGRGLCRQERPWVTSDGVWNSTDPDRTTEAADLIAPEVVSVQFEYASGTGYVSDWDGSGADVNGAVNQGPPRAVRMTFVLELPVKDSTPVYKTVIHVFPIRAAVGPIGSANAGTAPTTSDDTTATTGGTP